MAILVRKSTSIISTSTRNTRKSTKRLRRMKKKNCPKSTNTRNTKSTKRRISLVMKTVMRMKRKYMQKLMESVRVRDSRI